MYKALKNDVIPVAAKLLAADGDQDAFAQEVSSDDHTHLHGFTNPYGGISWNATAVWGVPASITQSGAP